jgi:serine phosphatase RsbU (regulator of sigma subunit)
MAAKNDALLAAFDAANAYVKAGYVEIATLGGGAIDILLTKSYDESFPYVAYENLIALEEFKKVGKESVTKFSVITAEKKEIFCTVIPVTHDETVLAHIIFQNKAAFELVADSFAALACQLSMAVTGHVYAVIKEDMTRKNKQELMNLRHIQAMLFPKFEGIEGYDVGNVLLPAQTMSGNFIDGFFLNSDVYQIVACVVSGHDATSPVVGSAVRTLVRSSSAANVMPSALVTILSEKITKVIAGVHYLVNINVFQLNIKSGRMSISAFGPLTALLFDAQKRGALNLGDTQIGKELAKRESIRDLSFSFHSGDSILYYTPSVINAESEDGKTTYGYSTLWDRYVKNIESPAVEHVHSITQSVFEFSNYSPLKEDVILVKIRKN